MATNPSLCAAFQQAYAVGVDADILILPTDTSAVLPVISSCVGAGLRAIEGPNELDLTADTNYAADDVAAMSLISASRGSLFPSSSSIVAPSLAYTCSAYQAEAAVNNDSVANDFDFNNAHIYFSGYQPENPGFGSTSCAAGPSGTEQTDLLEAAIPARTKPVVVTETGYPDDCCGYTDPGYVAPAIKTSYTLRLLLTHYVHGVRYAYIYELATEAQSYGLTDQYLNPKPAYTALENFLNILRDPGGTGVSGSLRFQTGASLASVSQVLFEKRDGSFWLVLWQPNQSWNPATNAPIANSPVSGTLTFAGAPAALALYTIDPSTGTTSVTPIPSASVVNISVSDTPEILQIGPTTSSPVLATPQPPIY